MQNFNIGVGEPVRSLQSFLREISRYYTTIPPIVPDGIFGEQTKISVMEFQKYFLINVTGNVDLQTWNKIVEIYSQISPN